MKWKLLFTYSVIISGLPLVSHSQSLSRTWTGAADSDFYNGANWSAAGDFPNGNATFSGTVTNNTIARTSGTYEYVFGLFFNNTDGGQSAFTIGSDPAVDNRFFLGGSVISTSDVTSGSLTDTLNTNILFAGTATTKTLTMGENHHLVINGEITQSGTQSLVKEGAGHLILQGKNTYTGGTTVNGGELHLDSADNTLASFSPLTIDGANSIVRLGPNVSGNNVFGSGALTIQNGGTLTDDTAGGNVHSVNAGLTFNNGGDLTSIGGSPNGTFGNYFINSNVTVTGNAEATISADEISINANRNFEVADVTGSDASDLTVSSVIRDWGTNSSQFTKSGAGTMTLTAANTYTGNTVVNNGTLVLNGGTSTIASGSSNTLTVDGASSFIRIGPGANAHNITNNNTINIQNGGTISDDTTGANVQSLQKVTFTNGGTLTSIGGSPNGTFGNYLISAGVDVRGNTSATITADAISLNNTQTFDVDDATSSTAVDLSVSSRIQNGFGTGNVIKTGAGTMSVSGTNTYTGTTTVSAGTLQLGDGGATGSLATSSDISVATGATFSVNQSDTVTQGTDFSANAITGAGDFEQMGAGTTVLTAANTYTGTTTVSAGTLRLDGGTIDASDEIAIASGAVFQLGTGAASDTYTFGNEVTGTGSVDGTFTASGVSAAIAPGDNSGADVGTLTFQHDLTFTGATLDLQLMASLGNIPTAPGTHPDISLALGDNATDPTGAQHDSIEVGGTLDLTNIAAINLDFTGYTAVEGDYFDLFDAATVTGADASKLSSLPALSGDLYWDTSRFSEGLIIVVPEPTSTSLLGLGALALLARRRR